MFRLVLEILGDADASVDIQASIINARRVYRMLFDISDAYISFTPFEER